MSKHILVVEDDLTARESLARALRAEGHTVLTAENSHDAAAHLAASPVDVALIDINLPDFPGDSLAAHLHLKRPNIRIIFMSGDYTVIDPERYGPDTLFLPKPLSLPALLAALNQSPTDRQHASLY